MKFASWSSMAFLLFLVTACSERTTDVTAPADLVEDDGGGTAEEIVPEMSLGGRMTVAWPMGSGQSMGNWSGDEGEKTSGGWASFCGRTGYTHSGADHYARDLNRNGGSDEGLPVYAGFYGRVVDAADRGAYGKTVVIYDASRRVMLRYAHLSSIGVSYGQWVSSRQYIGNVGHTGNTGGTSHLHVNGYENINHFAPNGDPIIPSMCDGDFYACAIYFVY